ncbi:MAG TPA: flagellar export protein FliJ [Spirochaetia bacterium]|nr:flagellar export protein FliJ [Spirochaetales bacterium]HRS65105.1 flagellar export protein FliJ [Spirochaetia bacterium]HPD79694.1 flagellar export protein FliJ [Spirochaetales bacterium]HQG40249.1 flagellar export protein FliJ [Spirochaetales bacterium]HQK33322.1 flagellar export protein FliJ [Spirochaetales bacterium]
MKPFEFSLEPLLEYRTFELDKIEKELSLQSGKLALLNEELESKARELLRIGFERFQKANSLCEIRAYELYSKRIESEKEKLIKAIAVAEVELEKIRAQWTEANKKKKVLEKMKEKKYTAWKQEKARQEILMLDEFGTGAHEREKHIV